MATREQLMDKLNENLLITSNIGKEIYEDAFGAGSSEGHIAGYEKGFAEGQASVVCPVPTPTPPPTTFKPFPEWGAHKDFLRTFALRYAAGDLSTNNGPPNENSLSYYAGWKGLSALGRTTEAKQLLEQQFIPKYFNLNNNARMRWLFAEGIIELSPQNKEFVFNMAKSNGFRIGWELPQVVLVDQWWREIAYAVTALEYATKNGLTIPPASELETIPWAENHLGLAYERLVTALQGCLSMWSGNLFFDYAWRTWNDKKAMASHVVAWPTNRTWKPFMCGLVWHAASKGYSSARLVDIIWNIEMIKKAWKPASGSFHYTHDINGKLVGEPTDDPKLNGLIYPGILWAAKKANRSDLWDFAHEVFLGADNAMRLNNPTKKECAQLMYFIDWTDEIFKL